MEKYLHRSGSKVSFLWKERAINMFKVLNKENNEISQYSHSETVFYKILAITGNKTEAMNVSDFCGDGYTGQAIDSKKYNVEIM
jgi:hypothetical protein